MKLAVASLPPSPRTLITHSLASQPHAAPPAQLNCLLIVTIIKLFLFPPICAILDFLKMPLLLLRTQGWISFLVKIQNDFGLVLVYPQDISLSPFPWKIWGMFSTPLPVGDHILLGLIHYGLIEIPYNQGFWDLSGFPGAEIPFNIWVTIVEVLIPCCAFLLGTLHLIISRVSQTTFPRSANIYDSHTWFMPTLLILPSWKLASPFPKPFSPNRTTISPKHKWI